MSSDSPHPMNKEDSKEGPYKVNKVIHALSVLWEVVGPTDVNQWFRTQHEAQSAATHLNAAYKAGVDSVKAIPEGEVVKMLHEIGQLVSGADKPIWLDLIAHQHGITL